MTIGNIKLTTLLVGALRLATRNMKFTFANHNYIPTTNLRTDSFKPVKAICDRGMFVPKIRDLVKGLNKLPEGVDARALTQCVRWWLDHQDVDMNVLEVRELFRKLQCPLKPIGPMNLDMVALGEWRKSGWLPSCSTKRVTEPDLNSMDDE